MLILLIENKVQKISTGTYTEKGLFHTVLILKI